MTLKVQDVEPTLDGYRPLVCDICGATWYTKRDAGYVSQQSCDRCYDDPEYAVRLRQQDEERERKQAIDREERLGLEGRMAEMRLTNFEPGFQADAFAAAQRFVNDWPHERALVLLGAPGTGKTHLIVATLWQIMTDRKVWVSYHSMVRLVNQWKRATDWGEFHREVVEPIASRSLIALDELGREARTDQMMAELDELLDVRYNAGMPTILGSNLSRPAFEEYLGESLWSRVGESNWAEIIVMRGRSPDNDYRRRLKDGR